jgi:hypothetical protein
MPTQVAQHNVTSAHTSVIAVIAICVKRVSASTAQQQNSAARSPYPILQSVTCDFLSSDWHNEFIDVVVQPNHIKVPKSRFGLHQINTRAASHRCNGHTLAQQARLLKHWYEVLVASDKYRDVVGTGHCSHVQHLDCEGYVDTLFFVNLVFEPATEMDRVTKRISVVHLK